MDFLEDIEEFNTAMDNAYDFVTGKVTLDTLITDLSVSGVKNYVLPFDPEKETGREPDTLDLVFFARLVLPFMCLCAACHLFLTALSLRPGNILVINAH